VFKDTLFQASEGLTLNIKVGIISIVTLLESYRPHLVWPLWFMKGGLQ
jgi:hypothetical protein